MAAIKPHPYKETNYKIQTEAEKITKFLVTIPLGGKINKIIGCNHDSLVGVS